MTSTREELLRAEGTPADALRRRPVSPLATALRQLRRNRGALIGFTCLLVLVLIALLAPLLAPYDPTATAPRDRTQPPSARHLFGTDNLGRDVFSGVIWGAQISLQVGLISVGIGATLGMLAGLLTGYYEGWLDMVLMRLMDVLLAFPGILLAISIVSVLGPGLNNAMLAVGIASVPRFTRVVRGSVLSAKQNVYVEAARALGAPDRTILLRHILPNVLAPVIVLGTLGIATAILSAAALSFLGLGARPPTPEWGAMLSNARSYLRDAWWFATFPGLAIMVTVLAMNLLGDGLRDALDPRLRER